MTDDSGSLRELLDRLQTALDESGDIDDDTRARLAGLDADIRERLAAAAPPATEDDSVDRLVVDFEVRHLRVAGIVEELIATLARMGI